MDARLAKIISESKYIPSDHIELLKNPCPEPNLPPHMTDALSYLLSQRMIYLSLLLCPTEQPAMFQLAIKFEQERTDTINNIEQLLKNEPNKTPLHQDMKDDDNPKNAFPKMIDDWNTMSELLRKHSIYGEKASKIGSVPREEPLQKLEFDLGPMRCSIVQQEKQGLSIN